MTTKEIEEKTKWLKKVDLNWSEANRMMKVAKELPNFETLRNLGTYTNLGTSALYFIATLPAEEFPNVETLRHLETSEHRENAKKPRRSASAIISINIIISQRRPRHDTRAGKRKTRGR